MPTGIPMAVRPLLWGCYKRSMACTLTVNHRQLTGPSGLRQVFVCRRSCRRVGQNSGADDIARSPRRHVHYLCFEREKTPLLSPFTVCRSHECCSAAGCEAREANQVHLGPPFTSGFPRPGQGEPLSWSGHRTGIGLSCHRCHMTRIKQRRSYL